MDLSRLTLGIFSLVALFFTQCTESAKILILPLDFGFNSRIINMAKMGAVLSERGHDVTFITNSAILRHFQPEHVTVAEYSLRQDMTYRLMTDTDVVQEMAVLMKSSTGPIYLIPFAVSVVFPFCRAMLTDADFIKKLKNENFDLMLVDIFSDCGRILRDYLDVPAVLYSNFGFTPVSEIFYPMMTSFVCNPTTFVCNSDVMTFSERVANFVVQSLTYYVFTPYFLGRFQEMREETGFNTSLSVRDSYKDSIVILNIDFVLEYPRPMMPHLIPIFGMFRKEPKPLPEKISAVFSDSSHESVIVVSFGTLVPKFSSDKAEMMARVFSRLPATVLWRFTGEAPRSLGANTRLTGWFPQADVLAHPKTRLFITHCGISSTHETTQNGVPVVAVPLFLDQRFNAERLVGRARMGVMVDFETLTENDFEGAILEVLSNQTYLKNAKLAASLLNDQEMPPREKFVYWVEYVIKHGGAPHLISDAVPRLNMLQFYSVDVIAFLASFTIVLMVFMVCCVRCTCNMLCGSCRSSKKHYHSD